MSVLTPGIRALFEGKNFGHLATIMPDGSPQVTVVWVDVEGDNILVNTAEGRVKPANVRRDPRVAISIYDQVSPYRSAAVQGEVVEIRSQGAAEHIDKLAKKYTGVDRYPADRDGRLVFVIKPDQAAGMSTD
jgi:PPOX class probable F420-dependent enzyme